MKTCRPLETKNLELMGTFVGHLVPGLAFIFLGLWHTFNTIHSYKLRGPSAFRTRPWYPFHSSSSSSSSSRKRFSFKHIELLFILSFSSFVIAYQILDIPRFRVSFHPDNLEHATMFLHLFTYAAVALTTDLTHSPEFFSGLVGIFAASVFGQELFLLHYHSTDHVGLEGHYHWLFQLIVLVSFLSAVATTGVPTSFPVALVRSVSIMFQGCWFVNMGFMLWIPKFVAEGCFVRVGEESDTLGAVICGSVQASERARALANLQFSWILAGILVFTACLCLKPAEGGAGEYEKLRSGGSDFCQISVDMDG